MNRRYRKTIIAGNWKMNMTASDTKKFADDIKAIMPRAKWCDVVVCVPFVNIPAALKAFQQSYWEMIRKAVELKPDDGYIVDSLAWVYFKQKKIRQAWQEIKRAVRFAPEDPVIWEHYGDIAAKIGNKAEAAKGYRNALKAKPDNPEAVRAKMRELQ